MVGFLAEGAAEPDGGSAQRGDEVCRNPQAGEPRRLGPREGVGPNLVDGVRRIKAQDGPDLILAGSCQLTSVVLEHGLADEVLLLVYPVLVG
ncbi:MAG TPA: dihydrofolate reductase family protein [Lacipirellulaceae bacterium]|nr:dihydrofolate reductase family protein [Lacipirellulaceae bacterium]